MRTLDPLPLVGAPISLAVSPTTVGSGVNFAIRNISSLSKFGAKVRREVTMHLEVGLGVNVVVLTSSGRYVDFSDRQQRTHTNDRHRAVNHRYLSSLLRSDGCSSLILRRRQRCHATGN